MTTRKSQEEAEKEIFTITNGEFSLVSEYVNGKGKSIFRHNSDSCLEPKQTKTYEGFKSNPRCMSCEKRKGINEMMLNLKGEIILLEETDTMTKKVKFKHVSENCKEPIFYMSPSRFKSRMRCPSCSFEKHCTPKPKKETDTNKEALEYNIEKYSERFSVSVNGNTLEMKCLVCGHQRVKDAHKKIRKLTCPKCKEKEKIHSSIIQLEEKGYITKLQNKEDGLFILTHISEDCGNFSFSLPKSSVIAVDKAKCPVCFDGETCHNRNTEWLKRIIQREHGGEYSVLGEYVGSEEKIKFRHNNENCKEPIFYKTAKGMKKHRCPSCYGSQKLSQKEFEDRIKLLTNGDIKSITLYKSTNSDVLFECQKTECKGMFYREPNVFYRKPTCPYCEGVYPMEKRFLAKKGVKVIKYDDVVRWTNENIIDYLEKNLPTYTFLKKTHTGNLLLKHNSDCCEHAIFEIGTTALKKKGKENKECCPVCKVKERYEIRNKAIKKRIRTERQNYELVKGVSNEDRENITVRHKEDGCNHEWYIDLYDFFNEDRECPKCSRKGLSKGEQRVDEFLKRNELDYKPWYRIEECKNKKPLPFDFAVFNGDESLNCLIEYDGQQHFYAIDFFGGEKALKENQKRDKIKNDYCKDNNIPLIRIPYWEFDNIEAILEKELAALGVTKEELTEPVLT